MFPKSRRRALFVFAALVGLLSVIVPGGGALAAGNTNATGWQVFGHGWAVNRGNGYGSPDIQLASVTKKNPEDVRYWIKNHAGQTRDVTVYWDLECWIQVNGFRDTVTDKSGSFDATIGGNKRLFRNPGFKASAEWCQLDVWVDYDFANFADNGRLTMKFQAEYQELAGVRAGGGSIEAPRS